MPLAKGQQYEKCFHVMPSLWEFRPLTTNGLHQKIGWNDLIGNLITRFNSAIDSYLLHQSVLKTTCHSYIDKKTIQLRVSSNDVSYIRERLHPKGFKIDFTAGCCIYRITRPRLWNCFCFHFPTVTLNSNNANIITFFRLVSRFNIQVTPIKIFTLMFTLLESIKMTEASVDTLIEKQAAPPPKARELFFDIFSLWWESSNQWISLRKGQYW